MAQIDAYTYYPALYVSSTLARMHAYVRKTRQIEGEKDISLYLFFFLSLSL